MPATQLDIEIQQGADYDGSFTLSFDATGYSAEMEVKPAGYPYPVLTLGTTGGTLVIDGATVTPVIPYNVSQAINPGRYLYDLRLISPSGVHIRAYQGSAYVSADVTDDDDGSSLAAASLLLESGGLLLLENGGSFLLESVGSSASGRLLLLENGGYLLLENGNQLSMES